MGVVAAASVSASTGCVFADDLRALLVERRAFDALEFPALFSEVFSVSVAAVSASVLVESSESKSHGLPISFSTASRSF